VAPFLDGVRELHDAISEEKTDSIIALNVVLAFNMGSDTQAVMDSDIGQPIATVRVIDWSIVSHSWCESDLLQRNRKERDTGALVIPHSGAVPYRKWFCTRSSVGYK
jgi:hypothetical protein